MLPKYYVYELIDPRDGAVFYVGKGKGLRVDQHEKDAKAGASLGRFDQIKAIWAAGLRVEKRIVERFDDEKSAYAAESALIAKHGADNLTNWTLNAGLDPEAIPDRERAKALLKIARKTAWFTQKKRWWFGQQWHELPDTFLPAMEKRLNDIVAKRGHDWLHAVAFRSRA